MKRALLAVLFVAVILLSAVTPTLAGAEMTRKGRPIVRPFALIGQVTATDGTAKTITVKVLRGNSTVKKLIGQELTVYVTDKTIFRRHGDPCEVIGFGDVEVDDYVSIGGRYLPPDLGGKYVALRVIVDVPVPTPMPTPTPAG